MTPMQMRAFLILATLAVGVGTPVGEGGAEEVSNEEARVWLEGLRPLRVLGDRRFRHAGAITRVEPLADGRRAVVCAADGTARLWDLETGEEKRRYADGSNAYVWMALVLPGEKQMLTTGDSNGVTLWDLETGEVVRKYDHGSATYRVVLAPDGETFFAVDSNDKGIIWNLGSGEKIREIATEKGGFYSGIYLEGGKVLATGGDDETLSYWEVATGKKLSEVKEEATKDIFTLALSPDGGRFAMCCEGGTLRLRVAKQGGKEVWQKEMAGPVRVAAWSPDGAMLAATCDDHNIYVVNAADGEVLKKLPVGIDDDYAVAFTRDGKEVIGAAQRVLYRFDVATGKRTFPEEGSEVLTGGVGTMAVSGTGEAYVGGAGGVVFVYDLQGDEGGVSRRIVTGAERVGRLGISPDGKRLLVADGTKPMILVIDPKDGKQERMLTLANSVNGFLFLEGGQVAVATSGAEVEIWEWGTGRRLRSLQGHTGSVEGLSLSADGKKLASFSDDGTARVWDVASGVQVDGLGKAVPEDGGGGEVQFEGGAFFGIGGRGLLAYREENLEYWEAPEVAEERPDAEAVGKLYAELNSDDFRLREAATAKLIKMGSAALKEIEALAKGEGGVVNIEMAMRLERVRSGIAGGSKMGEAKGSLSCKDGLQGLATHHGKGLWVAVEGDSAGSAVVVGDIEEGKPRILRRLGDPGGVSVFAIDAGRIVTGNRDGTLTVWGLE